MNISLNYDNSDKFWKPARKGSKDSEAVEWLDAHAQEPYAGGEFWL